MLPLALDDKVIGELLIVDDEKVATANSVINRCAYRQSLQVLLAADGLAIFKGNGLVIPELGIAIVLEMLLYEVLKDAARLVRFSARRNCG